MIKERNTYTCKFLSRIGRASWLLFYQLIIISIVITLGSVSPVWALSTADETDQPEDMEVLSGNAKILHMDAYSEDGKGEALFKLLLFPENGNVIILEIASSMDLPEGGIQSLGGKFITVEGKFKSRDTRVFVVHKLQVDKIPDKLQLPEVVVSKPWLAVLTLYPDKSDPLPSKSHFEGLLVDSAYPSIEHHIREISHNRANYQGSQVSDPYTLPKSYARYNFDGADADDYPEFHMDIFIPDIMSQVVNDIDITQFYGFFFITNYKLSCNLPPDKVCAFISGWNIYGNDYSTAVFGPWGYGLQTVFAHEAIHSFGIIHSSGPYNEVYDSQWDIMSGSGTCDTPHATYGCLGIHTIAWHKLIMGWINPVRNFNPGNIGAGIVNIERLESPPLESGNYLLAQLIEGASNIFYTVEYRRQLGYDKVGAIPGEAIILHHVNPARPDRKAQVVDPDNNGDPNDDGAMWLPGETFLSGTGVIVHVESMNDERAVVSVSNQARDPVYADSVYSGTEIGSPTQPWNTVAEAYASVTPSGNVYIKPGSYNETMIMSKPSVLDRWGSSGHVTIGQ